MGRGRGQHPEAGEASNLHAERLTKWLSLYEARAFGISKVLRGCEAPRAFHATWKMIDPVEDSTFGGRAWNISNRH
jgi:hypothetical protein